MLPVMDHKNNALKSPDARKVSDAIMRCMTKAISMHGLGLYIYAGEDLPEGEEPERPAPKATTRAPVIPATAKADTSGISANREAVIVGAADLSIELFNEGKEVAAYEAVSGIVETEEKLYLWNYLHGHSALRASLKKQAQADKTPVS
jgi:hypothetical protein